MKPRKVCKYEIQVVPNKCGPLTALASFNLMDYVLILCATEECEVSGGGGAAMDNSGAMKRRWSSESSDSNSRLGPGPTTTTAPTPSPSVPSTMAPAAKQPRKSVPG